MLDKCERSDRRLLREVKNKDPFGLLLVGVTKRQIVRLRFARENDQSRSIASAARTVEKGDGTTKSQNVVFHRKGEPVVDFRKPWNQAFKTAKVRRRLFHDFGGQP